MRLKTVQATAIKSVFEVLKDIISDINFVFDKDGVSMRTLDNAKVTFINLFLDARNFEFERLKELNISARTVGENVIFNFKGVETQVKKNR